MPRHSEKGDSRLVVLGATSGMAKYFAESSEATFSSVVLVSRSTLSQQEQEIWRSLTSGDVSCQTFDLVDDGAVEDLKEIFAVEEAPTLVLNFVGDFGSVKPWDVADPEQVFLDFRSNVQPHLAAVQASRFLAASSLLVAFSGAGVGGPNLDLTSLGYSFGKLAISGSVEALDRKLAQNGVRLAAVAPGAFPTKMQRSVYEASKADVDEESRAQAAEILNSPARGDRLSELISFLWEDVDRAGGRIWSAARDDLAQLVCPDIDFGRMRRT
jgi:short-subunit dehydrogenase